MKKALVLTAVFFAGALAQRVEFVLDRKKVDRKYDATGKTDFTK